MSTFDIVARKLRVAADFKKTLHFYKIKVLIGASIKFMVALENRIKCQVRNPITKANRQSSPTGLFI
jgi:hypothetical protein